MRKGFFLIATGMAMMAAQAANATIVYTFNDPVGAVGAITGTVTTDGSTGAISAANILAWNLMVQGNGASLNLTDGNSGVFGGGTALTATATDMRFNFSDPSPSYLLFQVSFGNSHQYACFASTFFNSTPCYQGYSAVPVYSGDSTAQYTGEGSQTVVTGDRVIGTVRGGVVPEPATWTMLLAGFAAVGLAQRRRVAAASA